MSHFDTEEASEREKHFWTVAAELHARAMDHCDYQAGASMMALIQIDWYKRYEWCRSATSTGADLDLSLDWTDPRQVTMSLD